MTQWSRMKTCWKQEHKLPADVRGSKRSVLKLSIPSIILCCVFWVVENHCRMIVAWKGDFK